MRISMRSRTTAGLAAIGLLLAGCSASGTPSRHAAVTSYVGKVTGTDELIAIAESADQVVAYVCDSKKVAWWFAGPLGPGATFDLTSRSGQRLTGAPAGDAVSITLIIPDEGTRTATAGKATGDAGLYWTDDTVDGVDYSGGWVVASATEQRGNVESRRRRPPIGPTTVHPGNPPYATEEGFIDPLKFNVKQLDGASSDALTDLVNLINEGTSAT